MYLKNKNLQNGNQATYQRSVSLRNFCFVALLIRVKTRPKLKKSFVILTRTTWVGYTSPSFVLQCRSSLFHVLVGTCWRLVWWSAGSGSEAVRQPGRHPQLSAFSSQPPASWPEGGAQAPGTTDWFQGSAARLNKLQQVLFTHSPARVATWEKTAAAFARLNALPPGQVSVWVCRHIT